MSVNLHTDWTIWLKQQQRIMINFLSRFVLILGTLVMIMTLSRVLRERTFTFNTFYYSIFYILLLIFFFVRKVPDGWRSLGFMFLLYAFGAVALYSGWLAGGGRAFLLAAIVISAVLISPRAGLYVAGLVFATYALFGIAFHYGWLTMRTLPDPTDTIPIFYEGVGFAMTILLVAGGLWFFGKALMAADRANREAQEARAALDVKTRELEAANELIARQSQQALKYSEEKFRNVIAQATDAIMLCNEEGAITDWNKAAEQITGIPAHEAVGGFYWDIQYRVTPQDFKTRTSPESLKAAMVNALHTGQAAWMNQPLDYQIQGPDGIMRFVQQIAFPIQTAKGYMISAILRDITDQKQVTIERENLIQKLESQNAELERFTYTVSHDLKTPLVTIRGYLGYLARDARNGDMHRLEDDIQRISRATDRMHALLKDLLELSRIGRLMNTPQDIRFNDLAQEALEQVQGRLHERGVQVHVQQGLPTVHGDAQRLLEVVQNLLDNAAKFMGEQPHPLIEIGQRGMEENKPVFFIKDNGIGIAAEYHERVFGLFNKLDPNMEGTGIGLALVKRIVEFHGGHIWVESQPGAGSTFCFTLPAR